MKRHHLKTITNLIYITGIVSFCAILVVTIVHKEWIALASLVVSFGFYVASMILLRRANLFYLKARKNNMSTRRIIRRQRDESEIFRRQMNHMIFHASWPRPFDKKPTIGQG